MAELVKAFGDFLAALLSVAGFVGKTRRRAAIREDLALLRELETHEEFARGTVAYQWLTTHILFEIASFSGIDLRTVRRKPLWGSALLASVIWIPLGWLTYRLIDTGHTWFAILPAIPAGLFFIVTFPLLFNKEEVVPEEARLDDRGGETGA